MSEDINKQDAINRIDAMFNLFGSPENAIKIQDISVERALEIAKEISNVGIRDGILYHFTKLSYNSRKEYTMSAARIAQILEQLITNPEDIAPVACLIISLDYLDIGFDYLDDKDNETLEPRLELLDSLVDWLISEGNAPSLIGLIHRSRVHNVPINIFLESVQAISYQEVLDSVKIVDDKEVKNDNTVVG